MLPAGPGFGASSAELGAGTVAAPAHPGSLPDQAGVLGVGAAGGQDHPIALLVSGLGTGAGLAGAGGRHHRGGGSVTPEGHVTLGNTWNRGRALALSFKKR